MSAGLDGLAGTVFEDVEFQIRTVALEGVALEGVVPAEGKQFPAAASDAADKPDRSAGFLR